MTFIASYSDTIDHGWHHTPLNQFVDAKHSVVTCQTVFQMIKDGFVSVVSRPDATTPDWTMQTWIKKVIVLAFRFFTAQIQNNHSLWRNNIDVWTAPDAVLQDKKTRIVPGAVRKRCHIGQPVINQPICTMQSSINIQAHINQDIMMDYGTYSECCAFGGQYYHISANAIIDGVLAPVNEQPAIIKDTQSSINIQAHINQDIMMVYGAYIGWCAFGGQYYHISANASIDGVLEPQNQQPAIIEDTVFFGTECHVAKDIHVEKNRILSSGALTGRTKTIDRTTKSHYVGHMPAHSIHYGGRIHKHSIHYGGRPAHSVGVPGPYSTNQHGLGIKWSIITKQKNKDSAKKINSQLGQ